MIKNCRKTSLPYLLKELVSTTRTVFMPYVINILLKKGFAKASKDENLVCFGHLWRCYDLIGSLGWRPPILPADNTTFLGCLLGGGDGKAFLVQSFGLTQPRAGRGVVYHESTLTIHHKRRKEGRQKVGKDVCEANYLLYIRDECGFPI